MKGIYGILILFVLALFVGACASEQKADVTTDAQENTENQEQMPDINEENEPEQNDEVENTQTNGDIPMSEIYDYASVKKFTYQTTTTAQGENIKTTFDYTLSSDTIDGKAAWLSTTEMETEGATVLSKVWSDKKTFGCLKVTSLVNFNGQQMETPAECPKEGPNSETTGTETPMVSYDGTETVTVPLGTFNTKKYSLDNTITYYYATGVPIPVKVTYNNVDTVMELVSWS